ncbi:MAG: DUF3888 domain-containing protein [Lachnospiraceae bacterium]|nr:DUF3888 domain-containing protein [Lachnospiraceae bacterium]
MNRILHIKLRTILGIACLVICVLPTTKNIGKSQAAEDNALAFPYTSDWTSLPLSDVALVNSYLSHIQEACRAYYTRQGDEAPTVSWYYVALKELQADPQALNPTIHITFTLMPYVDAHTPVGVDEVTFAASHTGQITLMEYKRVEAAAV